MCSRLCGSLAGPVGAVAEHSALREPVRPTKCVPAVNTGGVRAGVLGRMRASPTHFRLFGCVPSRDSCRAMEFELAALWATAGFRSACS